MLTGTTARYDYVSNVTKNILKGNNNDRHKLNLAETNY